MNQSEKQLGKGNGKGISRSLEDVRDFELKKSIISTWKFGLLLFGVILLSYFRTIDAPYQFDDGHTVEGNVTIRSLSNLPLFWTDAGTSSLIPENRNYRPLLFTGYALCWWIGKGATWPFHLFKILLQAGLCVGFFLIWRRLYLWFGIFQGADIPIRFPFLRRTYRFNAEIAAVVLTVLFALHPASTECVIYIASTSSLQAAFFYTWAFWFYLRSKETAKGTKAVGGTKYVLLTLLFYFLSSASKEEGITFPAMVFLAELLLFQNLGSSKTIATGTSSQKGMFKRAFDRLIPAFKMSLPYTVAGAIIAVWIVMMLPAEGGESRGRLGPLAYFATQWGAYLWYLKLLVWPFNLNADDVTMQPIKVIGDLRWLQFAIGNILLIVAALKLRKQFTLLVFGLAWFYVALAPTSSFIPLAEMVNERRMYISYVGLAGAVFPLVMWVLVWLLQSNQKASVAIGSADKFKIDGASLSFIPHRKRMYGWIFTVILVSFIIGVQERNRVWSSSENLWKDTLEKNPQSGRARNNLALVYMGQGRYEEAIKLLNECEAIWSTYPVCSLNKAISLQFLKRYDEAEASYKRTLNLQPSGTHANYHAGVFYAEVKRDFQQAAKHFAASSNATGGRYPAAMIRYAAAMRELGDFKEARRVVEDALRQDPNDLSGYFELGRIEILEGQYARAKEIFSMIVSKAPEHWGSWYNLGVAQKGLMNYQDALVTFQRVASAVPDDLATWEQIEEVAKKLQKIDLVNIAHQRVSRFKAGSVRAIGSSPVDSAPKNQK